MDKKYDPAEIEAKWQKIWAEEKIYQTPEKPVNKKYVLDMFPYPSGAGLHVGHMEGYVATDVLTRFYRMKGFSVLHPMGWDAFGLPAENYAIKEGVPPDKSTHENIKNFKYQLQLLGLSYDWSREIDTSSPDYYKWTQWLFIELFKKGLAYKKKAPANFCPKDETVLANEQVVDGKCERCGTEVVQKELDQWFFKITAYADKLISGLDKIDWPESTKQQQINWIGRKEGMNIKYKIDLSDAIKKVGPYQDYEIEVFTTRPDTNFGATFVVLAPEHALVSQITTVERKKEVEDYVVKAKAKKEVERMAEGRKKTGAFTGAYAINQLNGYRMPIWVSDFVLSTVGTGALVGVPGHDRRDFDFAKEFDLPVKIVVVKDPGIFRSYLMGAEAISDEQIEATGGKIVGREKTSRVVDVTETALPKYKKLVSEGLSPGFWNEVVGKEFWFLFKGKDGKVKEFILSGENIAEVAKLCGEFNSEPAGKTENFYLYLAQNKWYNEFLIQEEEGVMINSGFLDGLDINEATKKMMDYLGEKGWGKRVVTYHIRDWLISRQRYWGCPIPMIYCPSCAKASAGKQNAGWNPVADAELPVLLPTDVDFLPHGESPIARLEGFQKGAKCSVCGGEAKREVDTMDTYVDSSWYFYRFVDPQNSKEFASREALATWMPVDIYVGGGHVVQHLLFARFFHKVLVDAGYIKDDGINEPFMKLRAPGWILGPDSRKMSKRWGNIITPEEVVGKHGADTMRVYEMFMAPFEVDKPWNTNSVAGVHRFLTKVFNFSAKVGPSSGALERAINRLILKVSEDIENMRFNTAVSSMMEFMNKISADPSGLSRSGWEKFLLVLAPFAPHLAEELYQGLGARGQGLGKFQSVHQQSWPEIDREYLEDRSAKVAVSINGKTRGIIESGTSQEDLEKMAKSDPKIARYLEGKVIKKVVFVPGKIVNFVV